MPARVALALQADGWYVRSAITWCKSATMPESVQDRPTSATEQIYLLAKRERYYFDSVAIAEPTVSLTPSGNGYRRPERLSFADDDDSRESDLPWQPTTTRNSRNYWLLGPEPFAEAHFATFPTEIPRRAILAGTSERGCCPRCGAPWVRVVEREFVPQTDVSPEKLASRTKALMAQTQDADQRYVAQASWNGTPRGSYRVRTAAWRPSCACPDHEPIPCTVLDPCGGSGTTGLVADQLGRHAILCELNADYGDMARRRIQNAAPLFTNTTLETIKTKKE